MKEEDRFPEKRWQLFVEPEEQRVRSLKEKLSGFNITKARADEGLGLAIFVNDTNEQLLAGVYGWIWGVCLEVDYLWVQNNLRGLGYGKKLMAELEKEAWARGCQTAILDTYSFQAPAFYQKLGYDCFGIIDGYGSGYQKHFFKKELEGDPD